MNFYKHHIGDYSSHTRELTWAQDLAYRRMLEVYYLHEKGLPEDMQKIYRMVGASGHKQRQAVQVIVLRFFTLIDGLYKNKRAEEEIVKYQAQASTNRNTARQRIVTRTVNESSTNRSPNQNQIPEARTKPINQRGIEPTRIEQPQDPFDDIESQKHDDYPEVPAKPPQPKVNGERWWLTPAGIDKRGAEVNIKPERGEDYAQFKDRIFQEIARRRQGNDQAKPEH